MLYNVMATLATKPATVYVIGGILIALAVALVVAVLMQSAKDKGISGTISGGAETFFGKTKGSRIDRVLALLTIVGSAIFTVLTVVLVILVSNL